MHKQEFKTQIYSELAALTKAMANPFRLQIIELLAQSSRSVEEIAVLLSMSVANASQHLQVLKGANLVSIQKEGHYSHYRLANEQVYTAWQSLRDLAIDRMAQIERTLRAFREEKSSFRSVTLDELLQKIEQGNVLILDVRPEKEFQAGHIPQALSIPIDQLAQRILDHPVDGEVVVYCRGPFCVFADEAVALLEERGIQACRLEEGFPDWKARQLPVSIQS